MFKIQVHWIHLISFDYPRFPKNHQKTIEKRYPDVQNGFIGSAFIADCRLVHVFAKVFGVTVSFAGARCQLDIGVRWDSCDGHWHRYIGNRSTEIQPNSPIGGRMGGIHGSDLLDRLVFAWSFLKPPNGISFAFISLSASRYGDPHVRWMFFGQLCWSEWDQN